MLDAPTEYSPDPYSEEESSSVVSFATLVVEVLDEKLADKLLAP